MCAAVLSGTALPIAAIAANEPTTGTEKTAPDEALAMISQAIAQSGLQLYNNGDHEACFDIYEACAKQLAQMTQSTLGAHPPLSYSSGA